MKRVLLLGPQNDACLKSLAEFAKLIKCPCDHVSDFSQLRFSIFKDSEETRIVAKFNSDPLPHDIGILIRTPRSLVQQSPNHEIRFEMQEYFAALWSFCAMHPGVVINRPGIIDWQYDSYFKNRLFPSEYVSEYKATGLDFFAQARKRMNSSVPSEIHVENALTFDRTICSNLQQLHDLQQENEAGQFRAVMVESSHYLIQIVVGNWVTTVLNEIDYNVESEKHRAFIQKIISQIHESGVLFFAIVFTMIGTQLHIVRIETHPQFDWYAHMSDTINGQLMNLMQNGFTQRGKVS